MSEMNSSVMNKHLCISVTMEAYVWVYCQVNTDTIKGESAGWK